jgi:hypothetical protein
MSKNVNRCKDIERQITTGRENGRQEIFQCILGDEEKLGKGILYILL